MSNMLNLPLLRRVFVPVAASFAVLIGLFSASSLVAQNAPDKAHVDEVLKGLGRGHRLGPVAISPDGSLLAYVRSINGNWQVAIAPFSDPEKTTRITASKKDERCSESMVAWAPDSQHLAFVGDCPDGAQDNVYLA